ncbi:MAG TPA: hypothetical protein VJI98_00180 [Candidatus Nanoarchaeia archaeon]|nr:hypothetical protein [Candidatus Nanoarchaeia archaeon]
MKRIMPLRFRFIYVNASDSEERVQRVCNRIFSIARQNLIKKQQINQKGDETEIINSDHY